MKVTISAFHPDIWLIIGRGAFPVRYSKYNVQIYRANCCGAMLKFSVNLCSSIAACIPIEQYGRPHISKPTFSFPVMNTAGGIYPKVLTVVNTAGEIYPKVLTVVNTAGRIYPTDNQQPCSEHSRWDIPSRHLVALW